MSDFPARSLGLLRREGLRGVGIRLLSATVYRRLLVLALPLPLGDSSCSTPSDLAVQPLDEGAVDEYLRFRPDTDRAALSRRLHAGARCFVARQDGRIVQAGWAVSERGWIDYLGCELPLGAGDVLQFDSFTEPSLRGRGLAQARITVMAQLLQAEGHRRLLALVWPENTAGLRPLTTLGYRVVGRVAVLRLGPWRYVQIRGVHGSAVTAPDSSAYWDNVTW